MRNRKTNDIFPTYISSQNFIDRLSYSIFSNKLHLPLHLSRNAYKLLSAECATQTGTCSTDRQWCMKAYRQLWLELALLQLNCPSDARLREKNRSPSAKNQAFAARPGFEAQLCSGGIESGNLQPPCLGQQLTFII